MAFILAILLSFIPAFGYAAIVYWLDRFEKEPAKLLVGAFLWGAFVATIGAIIWTSVLQLGLGALVGEEAADLAGTTLLAPIVEEVLKGLAVAIIFVAFPHEFDSVLDGMVYGAITALGFAATENVLYLYFLGYQEGGYAEMIALFVLRVILGGWGHAVYTAFIGAGFAIGRLWRGPGIRLAFPLLGLFVAIFLHALHNSMAVILGASLGLAGLGATLLVDWIGWGVAFAVVVWAILRERRWIAVYLREEVDRGMISAEQYATACSLRRQLGARMRGRESRQFYETLAELAQKKHQLAVRGEELGNSARVAMLRERLAQLAPGV
ncbi:MAG TPA: PrsW family intramembrane metalloprotease [Chloroflexaceae bacterium]|nr:PrsW family intramembrane metalloprotease [Chloroflexaceae bacterium]